MAERSRLSILGIPVDRVNCKDALSRFADFMNGGSLAQIVTPNSEILSNADKDPELKALICGADLVIPDGIGLVYASRMLGQPFEERVTGIDFSYSALQWCAENGRPVYFLGSKPGIAEKAKTEIEKQIPGIIIAGARDGYFKAEEEPEVIEAVNASGAEFLCVALGSPKQEYFISSHREELKNVRVAVGIGGSLDVWSGTLKRAPQFYCDHGLEWLYRIIQEPARLKRSGSLPLFLIKVALRRGK